MDKNQRISIVGLGKLGASMMAGFASRGFEVIGVDVNMSSVDAINQGKAPVQETDLNKMLQQNSERISATLDYDTAIHNTDITFVIVPTPSDERGAFSVQYAKHAFESIGTALRNKDGYHVVVLTSTVLPGSTRHSLLPVLEDASGKKCGRDFGLCYSPEFIALGSVIRDFLNPDFYLVGQFDERSGDMLESVNSQTALNHAPCKRMTIENAELAKIALNSFVTLKISYANVIADLCESIPTGDVDVVTDALGMDKRVGKHYLKGGLGFGGPCFPRDNVALAFFGKSLNVDCSILEANDSYNRSHGLRIAKKIAKYLSPGATIAILGLAYKPTSHVVEDSQGVLIARVLADSGYRVVCYDPLAGEEAKRELKEHAVIMDDCESSLNHADAVVVTTPDSEFKRLSASELLGQKKHLVVVDCWRCLSKEVSAHEDISYIQVGCCGESECADETLADVWKNKGMGRT